MACKILGIRAPRLKMIKVLIIISICVVERGNVQASLGE